MNVNEEVMEKVEKATFLLLDVAGTTTQINFVKETLYPYFEKEVQSYITSNLKNEDMLAAIKQIDQFKEKKELDLEKEDQVKKVADELIKLTKEDSALAGVKILQGMVFAKGYENGNLKGHVFPDVASALPNWVGTGNKTVAIYSTGSTESQKLLFLNSTEGDLSAHIAKYFDQSVGPKTEAASYLKVAEELSTKPDGIVFLTDNVAEAKAAKEAGLTAVLVLREGNADITEEDKAAFMTISSFTDLPGLNSKRKIEEVEETEVPPPKIAKTKEEIKEKAEEKTETEVPTKKDEEKGEAMEVDGGTEEKKEKAEEENIEVDVIEDAKEETTVTSVEEKKPEVAKTTDKKTETEPAKEETPKTEEKTPAETKKTDEKASEEKMEVDAKGDDKKTAEEEQQKTAEVVNEEEKKTAAGAEKKEEKPVEKEVAKAEVTPKETETKVEETKETETKVEEVIKTELEEKKEDAEKTDGNAKAEEKTEEESKDLETKNTKEEEKTSPSSEEKENKSEVANGVSEEKKENGETKENGDVAKENGEKNGDVAAETTTKENGDAPNEEQGVDIKVKKIETEESAAPVSVEA